MPLLIGQLERDRKQREREGDWHAAKAVRCRTQTGADSSEDYSLCKWGACTTHYATNSKWNIRKVSSLFHTILGFYIFIKNSKVKPNLLDLALLRSVASHTTVHHVCADEWVTWLCLQEKARVENRAGFRQAAAVRKAKLSNILIVGWNM